MTLNRDQVAALLRRLSSERGAKAPRDPLADGRADTPSERAVLEVLAARLDDRPGKYDCPWCWFQRRLAPPASAAASAGHPAP